MKVIDALARPRSSQWRVVERQPLAERERWEDLDHMGDNVRLPWVRNNVLVTGFLTLSCCAVILFGEGNLRAMGLLGLFLSLGAFVPSFVGFMNTIRRISSGRGLVTGDPYRVEGVLGQSEDAGEPGA